MKQTSATIKRYLKAKTERGLERQMLANNVNRSSYHNYQIVHDGKSWFAWYDCDLSGMANKDIVEVGSSSDNVQE
ncbi:MAG: hypothetical protein CO099_02625 [Bdellovibrio sp. CG_4_9_14_3_um_filter_39_7]|nr:MAG: hypothetical protein CO099_02625 [Bdellovibrio sp. CG_4_9_14_3_um_filter_39_7]